MRHLAGLVEECARRADLAGRAHRFLVLGRSRDSRTRVVVLVFPEGGRIPVLLVKAEDASVVGKGAGFAGEAENLRRLAALAHPAVVDAVPRLIHEGEAAGYRILVTSAARGGRMKDLPPGRYFRSRAFERHMQDTLAFLAALHESSALPSERGEADGPANAALSGARAMVDTYRRLFEASAALDALLEDSARFAEGFEMPTALVHGDFCSANILVDDHRRGATGSSIQVIDWEHPLSRGAPLADLLHFLCSVWVVPYRRGGAALVANYEELFLRGQSARARRVLPHVRDHVAGLGLPAEAVLPAATLAWVAAATRKHADLGLAPRQHVSREESGRHLPLIMLRGYSCENLELLARHRGPWLLAGR